MRFPDSLKQPPPHDSNHRPGDGRARLQNHGPRLCRRGFDVHDLYERHFANSQTGRRVVLLAVQEGRFAGYLTIVWDSDYKPLETEPDLDAITRVK